MRRFELASRGDLVFQAALFLVVGGFLLIPSLLWPLGFARVNGKPHPETTEDWFLVAVISLFGLVGVGLGARAIRSPLAAELDPDGSIRFARLFGTTTTSVAEILEVDSFTATISEENSDPRMIRITHTRGTVTIPFSASADELVAELRRRTPSVVREIPTRTVR